MTTSLLDAARNCLDAVAPEDKVARTFAAAVGYARGELTILDDAPPPEPIRMPGRPSRPKLVHPRDLPQRGLGTPEGRAGFIHAIAHIEFNAIDLAWDAVYRFRGLPDAYYSDWVGVASDEARHFALLRERLRQLGFAYGDFDAHNGLWEMAEKTAHDGLARMALVPRVLEARGLDVTPAMIVKLRALGDDETAVILGIILREEIAHVAAGSLWFRWYCAQRGLEPDATFVALLTPYARGSLRGPFNDQARLAAGFSAGELAALAQRQP
ncbi:MAG: ferritin-like domain-containing protein [Gammaproteobacteria bacterium]|nr:ferritin-like domain-containing protein [Gammaproteobacteria bacterium]